MFRSRSSRSSITVLDGTPSKAKPVKGGKTEPSASGSSCSSSPSSQCSSLTSVSPANQVNLLPNRPTSLVSKNAVNSTLADMLNGEAPTEATSDSAILKCGLVRKFRSRRKKYFVLWADRGVNSPARLEYFDSEKKFRAARSQAKRSIVIRDLFAVLRKNDPSFSRKAHVFALYTKDDCFGLWFDEVDEYHAWYSLLRELHLSLMEQSLVRPEYLYEYIWYVSVAKKGLGPQSSLSGCYYLCLTPRSIHLFKTNAALTSSSSASLLSSNAANMANCISNGDHVDLSNSVVIEKLKRHEFPLNSIRRCGHSSNYFILELGRSSNIGSGELWLIPEDCDSAQYMHEVVVAAMCKSREGNEFRGRSSSSSENGRPLSSRRKFESPSINRAQMLESQTASIKQNANEANSAATCSSALPTSPTVSYTSLAYTLPAATVKGLHTSKPLNTTPTCMNVTPTTSTIALGNSTQCWRDSCRSSCSCSPSSLSGHMDHMTRQRCDSLPTRCRSTSEGNNAPQPTRLLTASGSNVGDTRTSSNASIEALRNASFGSMLYRNLSYSPPLHANLLSPSSVATDSTNSLLFTEEGNEYLPIANHSAYSQSSSAAGHGRETHLSTQPSISESEEMDYLCIEPINAAKISREIVKNCSNNTRDSLQLDKQNMFTASTDTLVQKSAIDDDYMMIEMPKQTNKEISPMEENDYLVLDCGKKDSETTTPINTTKKADDAQDYVEVSNLGDSNNSFSTNTPGSTSGSVCGGEYGFSSIPDYGTGQILYSSGSFSSQGGARSKFKLEKVRSFFSPVEQQEADDFIKPVRTYSIGSRPQLSKSKNSNTTLSSNSSLHCSFKPHHQLTGHKQGPFTCSQCLLNSLSSSQPCDCPHADIDLETASSSSSSRALLETCRARAHSMGSQLSSARERLRARLRPTMEADLSACNPINETSKEEKSCSTPILANSDQHRNRSATVGSRMALLPTSGGSLGGSSTRMDERSSFEEDDLMVIDYTKGSLVMDHEYNMINCKDAHSYGNSLVNGSTFSGSPDTTKLGRLTEQTLLE